MVLLSERKEPLSSQQLLKITPIGGPSDSWMPVLHWEDFGGKQTVLTWGSVQKISVLPASAQYCSSRGAIGPIDTGASLRRFQWGASRTDLGFVPRYFCFPSSRSKLLLSGCRRICECRRLIERIPARSRMYWPGALYQAGLLSAKTQNHPYWTHKHQLFSNYPTQFPSQPFRTSVRTLC